MKWGWSGGVGAVGGEVLIIALVSINLGAWIQ